MTGKEYLQFLAMMVPTFLLLAALALSLAFPAGTAEPAERAVRATTEVEVVASAAEEPGPTWLEIAYAH